MDLGSIKSLNRSVSPVWSASYHKRRHSLYPKTDSAERTLSQSNEKLNFYKAKLQSLRLEHSIINELIKNEEHNLSLHAHGRSHQEHHTSSKPRFDA